MTDASTAGATDSPARSPSGNRRWLKWVLVASLAFNALFIGMAASAIWRFGGPPAFTQNVPGNLVAYVDTLPRSRERALMPGGKEIRQSLQPLRRELRDARRDLLAIMAASRFDKAAYEQAQAKVFGAEHKLRLEQGALLADVAANLTPEERQSYLRWFEHRRLHRRRGAGPDDDVPPAPK